MTTATHNYGWLMPDPGGSANTWGNTINGTTQAIDTQVQTINSQVQPNSLFVWRGPDGGAYGAVQFLNATETSGRWLLGETSETESGSNAGTNFVLRAYDDSGNYLGQVFEAIRATQGVAFAQNVSVSGALSVTGAVSVTSNMTVTGAMTVDLNASIGGNLTTGGFATFTGFASSANSSINGGLNVNGSVGATGTLSRNGLSGTNGSNQYNHYWTGSQNHLYLDNSDWGQIQTNSDYRMKKNVAALGSMWEQVKALRPISYTHRDWTPPSSKSTSLTVVGDNVERWGFFAHELQETLVESAANGVKDDPVAVQSPTPFTIIAALTKALQEAMMRIEALEAAK